MISTFNNCQFNRRKDIYLNVQLVTSFSKTDHDGVEESIQPQEGTEIHKIKLEMKIISEKVNYWREELHKLLMEKNPDVHYLRAVLSHYDNEVEKLTRNNEKLDMLYEHEITNLLDNQEEFKLPERLRKQLTSEYGSLLKKLNLGMRDSKEGTEFAITESFFEQLRLDFRTEFPLMFDMLHSLFPTDAGEHSRRKELSAVHALCLLMSLKNPYAKNDVKLLFSILLMSYGVGCRLMNTLCRMGLTLSWQTLDNFLVKQMEENDMKFKTMTPVDIPVLILMDNINMYRGAKKYVRLLKVFGPTMWNFTGRGIMLPNIDKIKPFFEDKSTAVDGQRDVLTMECDDILIDSNTEHSTLWDSWLNYYLLCLIDKGLNTLVTDKALNSMTESEINKWLSEKRFENRKGEFIINLGSPEKLMKDDSLGSGTSKMFVLPLSLENNATATGTAAILKEFADKLQIPCEETREFLPFDEQSQTFSVRKAREHSDFLHMIQEHGEEMKEFEKLLVGTEKTLEPRAANADVPDNDSADSHANATNEQRSDLFENLDLEEFDDIYTDSSSVPSSTLEGKKKLFQKEDKVFWSIFNNLQNTMWKMAIQGKMYLLLQQVSAELEKYCVKDHFGRTILHVAVEKNDYALTELILRSGFNPNPKEHCGATPLTLAVLEKSVRLCQILVDAGAKAHGPLFTTIPSPLDMSLKLNCQEITDIFKQSDNESDEEDIILESYDPQKKETVTKRNTCVQESIGRTLNGYLTGVVGDVGTCKTNRSVTERSNAYQWLTNIPGDLHMKGSFCESCFVEQGPGGLHYLTQVVMKRPKLTADTFRQKKYEKNNLRLIKEAVRDCARSYGIAAVKQFESSPLFPTPAELNQCEEGNGQHNDILFNRFIEWLTNAMDINTEFRYRARMFMHFGPLLELFETSTSYTWGLGRETCYLLHTPTYAQLGLRNYYTECFIHVINFLANWPLAFRYLVQHNSSVNLSGKKGTGMELDSWVETFIVQPTKRNTHGQSTVKTCQRIVGNLNLVDNVRKSFTGRNAFDEHTTKRHSVPSPLPDQLKGAWYCVKHMLLPTNKSESLPTVISSHSGQTKTVDKRLIDVNKKGVDKMRSGYRKKLYDCFPELRYKMLSE